MSILNAAYWERRYQDGRTGWDIHGVSPAFLAWAQTIQDRQASILLPGCGHAHEARYLLEQGFQHVHVLDFAPLPLQRLRQSFPHEIKEQRLTLHELDFFRLTGQFDWIFEQTFFCALPISLRSEYARHMHSLLSPTGYLVGLLFNRSFPGPEPPFGGSIDEYRSLFEPYFHLHHLAPTPLSIPPRRGSEVWIQFSKK